MNLLSTKGPGTLSLPQVKYEKQRSALPITKLDQEPTQSCEQAGT